MAAAAGLPSSCPSCSADLRGEEFPAEDRSRYAGAESPSRAIGLYGSGQTHSWLCPDCGHCWPRTESLPPNVAGLLLTVMFAEQEDLEGSLKRWVEDLGIGREKESEPAGPPRRRWLNEPICPSCWVPWCIATHDELLGPVRFTGEAEPNVCAFCGTVADEGIFVRVPAEVCPFSSGADDE